jgi:hypothetical protein
MIDNSPLLDHRGSVHQRKSVRYLACTGTSQCLFKEELPYSAGLTVQQLSTEKSNGQCLQGLTVTKISMTFGRKKTGKVLYEDGFA